MSDSPTTPRRRVLVITPDVIGVKMAGPGIRAFEIASALHRIAEVRLVSTEAASLSGTPFPALASDDAGLREHVAWAEVVVFQGHILASHPWIGESDVMVVADIYDPMHLEALEHAKELPDRDREALIPYTADVLNKQLERADFLVCASEKQRDFWLGQLGAVCRINSLTYDRDPSLRDLIDVAPFGIPEEPPAQTRRAIKGVEPGIGEDDQVIIWGGGVYNWFDPLTLIRAVAELVPTHPTLRLYFLGIRHPNPHVPTMRVAVESMRLAEELGLTGTHVFFNTEWVDYEDRVNYLLDADLGVSTHFDHIETAFSFRTRILDYLWAGLPIVATDGDTFAPLIREHGLGAVVPPEDVAALADAIRTQLSSAEREETRRNVRAFGRTLTWSRALRPLIDFCAEPRHAADYPERILAPRERERRHLKQRVEELESSSSWRLTRPLRAASERLGRGR